MTGVEFFLQLQQKYDKAYSAYLDDTKAERLIKEALYRSFDKIFSLMDTQKEMDELSYFLKYNQSLPVVGTSVAYPSDYYHLMGMACVYVDEVATTSIGTTSVLASKHGLRKGDTLSTSATGSAPFYTVTSVSKTGFNVDTNIPGGTTNLYHVVTYDASPSTSDKKKPSLSNPVKQNPIYYTGENTFIPSPTPYSVVVDYLAAPFDISVTNTIVDLTDFYSQKFLYRLMDECVYSVASETRDYQNKQSTTQTIIDNP